MAATLDRDANLRIGNARLDAVIVPASRPAHNLRHAIGVARKAGCPLVLVCSGHTNPSEAAAEALRRLSGDRVIVIDLPAGWGLPGLDLAVNASPLFRNRFSDTATKRNLGIVLARMLGWRNVLFLDDDVRGFGMRALRRALAVLASGHGTHAVGWAFDDFPDNSMVCHAYRLAGGHQSTFIGGGALGVRVTERTPFFPTAYNEDWLFMFPLIQRKPRALTLAGTLHQTPFNPFERHGDAQKQEAGDILAEGLFRLRHFKQPLSLARSDQYWREMLALRQKLITCTKQALVQMGTSLSPGEWDAAVVGQACGALDESLTLDHKSTQWAELLAQWVAEWELDQKRWARYLSGLMPQPSVRSALELLGLEDIIRPALDSRKTRPGWARPVLRRRRSPQLY